MKKILRLTLAVMAGLALVSGNAWAGTAVVLGDGDLANVWAGDEENVIGVLAAVGAHDGVGVNNGLLAGDDFKVNAATDNGMIAGDDATRKTDVTDTANLNLADFSSIANSGTINQTVSHSQNDANGQNLNNSMLSAVSQQNNIAKVSARTTSHGFNLLSTTGGVKVLQSNTAINQNFSPGLPFFAVPNNAF